MYANVIIQYGNKAVDREFSYIVPIQFKNKIREVTNRSFSVSIYLKSEVKGIDLEIKKTSTDKGEEILKSIVSESVLEIKDHIE